MDCTVASFITSDTTGSITSLTVSPKSSAVSTTVSMTFPPPPPPSNFRVAPVVESPLTAPNTPAMSAIASVRVHRVAPADAVFPRVIARRSSRLPSRRSRRARRRVDATRGRRAVDTRARDGDARRRRAAADAVRARERADRERR